MGAERFSATPCKNVTRGNFGSDFPANVGESKGIGSACRMSSRRREWKFGSVNPGNGSSEKAKLEMVIDGGQVAALRIKRADFVLDFLESAFDFPSGGIIFDHPFGRERKIGRDQRESKVAVVNEDDFDPAFQCFGFACCSCHSCNRHSFVIRVILQQNTISYWRWNYSGVSFVY